MQAALDLLRLSKYTTAQTLQNTCCIGSCGVFVSLEFSWYSDYTSLFHRGFNTGHCRNVIFFINNVLM